MSGILLDTNVISELTRNEPDPSVVSFLRGHSELWIATVVLHELAFGLRLLPRGRRREELQSAVAKYVTKFEDRILQLDRRAAEDAADLRARAQRSGRVLHMGDALIAGTAKAHDMAVATRNTADFDGLDVAVINPWEGETRSTDSGEG